VPGHPADPARCHLEDGPAISVSTAQMLACIATLSWMQHDHERGHLIASAAGGAFVLYHPDGTVIPPSPALPDTDGPIDQCHDADITPDTIIPAWYGERLDLDYAIYTCFANADYHARHPGQRDLTDQQLASTTASQEVPWTPTATEVDIIAGIRKQCQKYASTGLR
jgi:hypothetical protein